MMTDKEIQQAIDDAEDRAVQYTLGALIEILDEMQFESNADEFHRFLEKLRNRLEYERVKRP